MKRQTGSYRSREFQNFIQVTKSKLSRPFITTGNGVLDFKENYCNFIAMYALSVSLHIGAL
ncbi:MAG: hypothetical protein CMJ80_04145 [Planctomycetaceae bacterium]|nr:hypothetical protein [Planctomycetaceae bacterium]